MPGLQPPEPWTEIFQPRCWSRTHSPLEHTKKSLYPETWRRNQEAKGQVHSRGNQIPCHPAGQPTDWTIIKSQNFSHRSGSWAPCQAPQSRGQSLGGGASRALGFTGQQGLTAGASPVPPGWGKQPPPSEDTHRCSGWKLRFHTNLGQTYFLVLEGLLGRWGQLWVSGIIKAGGWYSGDLCECWVESDILSPWHWDPTQQPVSSNAGHLKASQRGRKWPCPSADRLPRLLDSQPPLDTSLDRAWPTKGPRPCCTHEWGGTSPSHPENLHRALRLASPTRAQTPEARKVQFCRTEFITRISLRWDQLVPDPLLGHKGHPLQRAPSLRWRSITKLLYT